MKNKILFSSLIIFFTILFLIFYSGLKTSNIYTPSIDFNEKIPEFTANLFGTKNEVSSKEIFSKDHFYLVNVWSSWCIPCRDEHDFLVKLNKNENIEIVGLNYRDKKDNAKKFLKELSNPYKKILSDEDGTISIEWGAYGVPESFLIYNKKIIKKILGPINESSFLEINKLLK